MKSKGCFEFFFFFFCIEKRLREREARATGGGGDGGPRGLNRRWRGTRTCTKNSAATAAVPPHPAALVTLLGVANFLKVVARDMVCRVGRCEAKPKWSFGKKRRRRRRKESELDCSVFFSSFLAVTLQLQALGCPPTIEGFVPLLARFQFPSITFFDPSGPFTTHRSTPERS